jgi:hypothetical protein
MTLPCGLLIDSIRVIKERPIDGFSRKRSDLFYLRRPSSELRDAVEKFAALPPVLARVTG